MRICGPFETPNRAIDARRGPYNAFKKLLHKMNQRVFSTRLYEHFMSI